MEDFSKVCGTYTGIENEVEFSNISDAMPNNANSQIRELLHATAPGLNIQGNDELLQQVSQECLNIAPQVQEFQEISFFSELEICSSFTVDAVETECDKSLFIEPATSQADDILLRNPEEMQGVKQQIDESAEFVIVRRTVTEEVIAVSKEDTSLSMKPGTSTSFSQNDNTLQKKLEEMLHMNPDNGMQLENFVLVSDKTSEDVAVEAEEEKQERNITLPTKPGTSTFLSETDCTLQKNLEEMPPINPNNDKELSENFDSGLNETMQDATEIEKGSQVKVAKKDEKKSKKPLQDKATDEPEYFGCLMCGKSFETLPPVIQHIRDHKQFKCVYCSCGFAAANELLEHHFMAHYYNFCRQCLEIYDNKEVLLEHNEQCFGFNCDICSGQCQNTELCTLHKLLRLNNRAKRIRYDEINDKINQVNKHLLKVQDHILEVNTTVNNIQTMDRDGIAGTANNMEQPGTTPNNTPTITTAESPQRIEELENQPNGLLTKDSSDAPPPPKRAKKSFPCMICDKTYSHRGTLFKHRKLHKVDGQPFECSKCNYRYADEISLWRHQYTNHVFFDCGLCDERFQMRGRLEFHMVDLHREELQGSGLVCKMCPATFSYFTGYTSHFRSHLQYRECEKKKGSEVETNQTGV